MLAQAEHLDIFHYHHLIVGHREQGFLEQRLGIFFVALGQVLIGAV
jgi:hypothetical protein